MKKQKQKTIHISKVGYDQTNAIRLQMFIPQTDNHDLGNTYALFRRKVLNKSKYDFIAKVMPPKRLVINRDKQIYNTQPSVVVIPNSFTVIVNDEGDEIGFMAEVVSGLIDTIYNLIVLKKGIAVLVEKKGK